MRHESNSVLIPPDVFSYDGGHHNVVSAGQRSCWRDSICCSFRNLRRLFCAADRTYNMRHRGIVQIATSTGHALWDHRGAHDIRASARRLVDLSFSTLIN